MAGGGRGAGGGAAAADGGGGDAGRDALAALATVAPAASPMASAANSEAGRRAPGTHYSPSVSAGGVLDPGQACVLAELDSLDAEIEGLHVSSTMPPSSLASTSGAPGAASE